MSAVLDMTIFFDLAITILLVITIVYAVKLNKKLSVIRDARDGMGDVISEFSGSVDRAEQGLSKISAATAESSEKLKQQIGTADRIADDLALLEKRAELAADRLEGLIAEARDQTRAAHVPEVSRGANPGGIPAKMSSPMKETKNPFQDLSSEIKRDIGAATEPAQDDPLSEEQNRLLKVLQDMR